MKNKILKNSLLFCFFVLVSFLAAYSVGKSGQIMSIATDAGFHFSRVEQIYENLRHEKMFTFIATNTFHQSGIGSFLFYPTVFLYPWAGLRFLMSPVNAFYCWYGLMIFITLLVSFYSMKSFTEDKKRSLIFALVYTFALYRLQLGIGNFVLGEFIATTFLPLAFVGFYHVFWGDYHKWYDLAIGVSLVAYSHFLTFF